MRLWLLLALLLVPWTLGCAFIGLAMRDGSRLVTDIGRWAGYPAVETQLLATALGEAGPAGQALVVAVWVAGALLAIGLGAIMRASR
ncbi:hypothetical protein [Thermaurantiacus sp.]